MSQEAIAIFITISVLGVVCLVGVIFAIVSACENHDRRQNPEIIAQPIPRQPSAHVVIQTQQNPVRTPRSAINVRQNNSVPHSSSYASTPSTTRQPKLKIIIPLSISSVEGSEMFCYPTCPRCWSSNRLGQPQIIHKDSSDFRCSRCGFTFVGITRIVQ